MTQIPFLMKWNQTRNQQHKENWKIHKSVEIKQHILKQPMSQEKWKRGN